MTASNNNGNKAENPSVFDIENSKLVVDLAGLIRPTMTIKEVAELLFTTEAQVLRYAKIRRELPYIRIGKSDLVFLRKDVLEFLELKKTKCLVEKK